MYKVGIVITFVMLFVCKMAWLLLYDDYFYRKYHMLTCYTYYGGLILAFVVQLLPLLLFA